MLEIILFFVITFIIYTLFLSRNKKGNNFKLTKYTKNEDKKN